MSKHILIGGSALVVLVLAGAGCGAPDSRPAADVAGKALTAQDATYLIDGEEVALAGGPAETSPVPGTASKKITRYFGNDASGDLNGDGQEDTAFLLTQKSGGTGVSFYAAAALAVDGGFQGTNAILLGDGIAPQTTEIRDGVIIVNYADRPHGEPFTEPSFGLSKYFRVVDGELTETSAPAIVDAPAGTLSEAEARAIAERTCIKGGESLAPGYRNDYTKTWWFDANLNSTREGCNPACVVSDETRQAEINWRCTGLIVPR